jgi:hypothetical protein
MARESARPGKPGRAPQNDDNGALLAQRRYVAMTTSVAVSAGAWAIQLAESLAVVTRAIIRASVALSTGGRSPRGATNESARADNAFRCLAGERNLAE